MSTYILVKADIDEQAVKPLVGSAGQAAPGRCRDVPVAFVLSLCRWQFLVLSPFFVTLLVPFFVTLILT